MEQVDISKLPDINDIINIVAQIRFRLNSSEMKDLFNIDQLAHRQMAEDEFEHFYTKYPTLFNKIYKNDDLKNLAIYLKMIEQIKNGNVDFKKGETKLAEMMAEEYLPTELYQQYKNIS